MWTGPAPAILSYYIDLVLGHQPGQGLFWINAVIKITVLAALQFLDACRDVNSGLMFHDDRMCRSGRGVWVPFACKICKRVYEAGLSQLLGGSLIDPFTQFSPSQRLLRLIRLASGLWIHGSYIVGKLARFSTY